MSSRRSGGGGGLYRTRSDTLKLQRLIDVLKERGSDLGASLESSASEIFTDVKRKISGERAKELFDKWPSSSRFCLQLTYLANAPRGREGGKEEKLNNGARHNLYRHPQNACTQWTTCVRMGRSMSDNYYVAGQRDLGPCFVGRTRGSLLYLSCILRRKIIIARHDFSLFSVFGLLFFLCHT